MKKILSILFYLSIFSFISNAQRVGVNAPTPSDALHVVGTPTDNPLRVQIGTATKLRVLNNGGTTIGANNTTGTPADGLYVQGNTGLGVGNPVDKLAVGGSVNITGEIKANGVSGQSGQILQANGDGTMGWANTCNYKNFSDFIYQTGQMGNASWTVPSGVTEIMVEMWGGGGGGGVASGGGEGGYLKFVRPVTPNEVIAFVVGKGGGGVTSNDAQNGEDTTFPFSSTSTYTAKGGGNGNESNTFPGGRGGLAFSGPAIKRTGANGKPTEVTYFQVNSTQFATKTIYGQGGSSFSNAATAGHGVNLLINNSTGLFIHNTLASGGNQPGGGGGGGRESFASVTDGGDGGNGYVIIYW
jgi:hypothetical protein